MTGRDRIVLVVLVMAAAVAGFWFMLLAPKRDEATKLAAKITQAHQELEQARASATNAAGAKARYDRDYATVARLGKAVPADIDMASLLYQIQSAARASHVDFRSISLSSSAPAAAPAAAPPAAQAAATGAAEKKADGADKTSASATPAAPTQTAAAGLPPGATVGPAGFPVMPFTFDFDGSFFHMEDFLHTLAAFTSTDGKQISVRGRLLTIDGISLTASRQGFPRVRAAITANAFLVPSDEGLTGGATPQTPGTGATPASASGGASATTPATAFIGGTK